MMKNVPKRMIYIILSFKGDEPSGNLSTKSRKVAQTTCPAVDIRLGLYSPLIVTPRLENEILRSSTSFVIYLFSCFWCGTSSVGCTTSKLFKRVREHKPARGGRIKTLEPPTKLLWQRTADSPISIVLSMRRRTFTSHSRHHRAIWLRGAKHNVHPVVRKKWEPLGHSTYLALDPGDSGHSEHLTLGQSSANRKPATARIWQTIKAKRCLTAEQENFYRGAFDAVDTNKDKKIDARELENAMKKLGMTVKPGEAEAMVKQFDKNKNGTLEFEEYVDLCEKKRHSKMFEELFRGVFSAIDKNHDGYLTEEEIRAAIAKIKRDVKSDTIKKVMEKMDKNKDGRVSMEEFLVAMRGE
ncbi:unnamed protein product [Calicophoron daubneyi]|uniref:EF-hand domain-containing protein n=1 Tax=Calicophoron daubneyi TaxID=300641 RepID=A0AAV2T8X0_CALDB